MNFRYLYLTFYIHIHRSTSFLLPLYVWADFDYFMIALYFRARAVFLFPLLWEWFPYTSDNLIIFVQSISSVCCELVSGRWV